MLIAHPRGHYHFLQGIDPYSCGVVADAGYEIIHVALARPLPWRDGFGRIEDHLQQRDLDRQSLCAIQLRSPAPFTMQGFREFNQQYCQTLKLWDVYVDDLNPVARTNVAPIADPPRGPVLYAFSYVAPAAALSRKTFFVAGAGELREGILDPSGIIRAGETSAAAMREKATYVMSVMTGRLEGLGGSWDEVDEVNVYTAHPLDELLHKVVWPAAPAAGRRGVRCHHARPPVVDIEFEMDLHGVVSSEVIL